MLERRIEELPVSSLTEPRTNPNVMESRDFQLLKSAINEAGFLQPVLVRNRNSALEIVDGVHRVRAARELGLEKVPCVVVSTDDALASALQVGMNRLRGELDLSRVAKSLSDLADAGWTIPEMTLTGFDEAEIESLIKATTTPSEEDVLAGGTEEPELEPETERPGTSVLEVEFTTRKEMLAAKRKLRKIVGKGNPLGNAIIQLLESEE